MIRKAEPGDLSGIINLCTDTIRTVNAPDYDHRQLEAWIDAVQDTSRWQSRLAEQLFILEEDEEGALRGFSSLTNAGVIDVLFVSKQHQRTGVAQRLLKTLEKTALSKGILRLEVDVSITARPFFLAMGFRITGFHTKTVRTISFENALMEKILTTEKND